MFRNVKDVVAWRLCLGCGACAFICPKSKIELIDILHDGIRPQFNSDGCNDCNECLQACPGYEAPQNVFGSDKLIHELRDGWGPVLELWEGYATDNSIRFNGSSGGLVTALSLYCIENEDMNGVLHTGSKADIPWKNKTVFSKNRDELLSRTGSRYSPASPCDGLDQIESSPGKSVFIGKPCDVAGLRKAQKVRKALDNNVGVAIGIFCAGTPSTEGTLDLMRKLKINTDEVDEIRYRGKGWPGMFDVRLKGENILSHKITYEASWGFIQKYRPYRCYLCPDGTSEFADLSCGDSWYRMIEEVENGYSLVLVRTERGRRILEGAIKAGYVHLEKVSHTLLIKSQKNLLEKRGSIWGRLLLMKMFFIPIPKYNNFVLFKNWKKLSIKEKLQSLLGTARRIVQRKYFKPCN